ncbi:MAG: hypothetical protein NTW05_20425, partial [Pseudonocardiales bacterium]|nr:hypothetical protein [Pseudonocardiales bacterium]
AAGAALAWVRVVAGPAPDDLDAVQRVDAAVLASALVAVGLGLVLAAGWGPAGAGAAVVAGPVAALVTGTVFLGQVALLGGNPLAFAGPVLFGGVAAAAVLTPPALLAGALPGTRFGPMVASVLVVTLAAGTAGLVMVGRDVAVPGLAGVVPGRTELAPPGPAPVPPAAAVGPELYGATVAPVLAERRTAVSATVRDLVATAGSDVAFADGLRRDVVPPLRDALLAAEAVRVDDPGLRAVHDEALAALRLEVAGYGDLVAAIDAGDVARAEEAQRVIGSADPHWERWALGVPS